MLLLILLKIMIVSQKLQKIFFQCTYLYYVVIINVMEWSIIIYYLLATYYIWY